MAKGNISVNSENIFPIIKKWLYSDKDIFLRELVSNASDAITKLKKLSSLGEAKGIEDDFKIEVILDKDNGTLSVSDNGIGMTKDEVIKYITEIAFSGATDFIEKYKDDDKKDEIIGHFGLGFYSAFMPSDTVTIETLSYKENEKAVKWTSDGSMEYEIEDGTKLERGTLITLKISEDSKEFLDEMLVRATLNKYCSFLPYPIFLTVLPKNEEETEQTPVNDTNPLWTKKPSEVKDEEYLDFYRKTFLDFTPPLFWIHLNIDYPFNLKGILYFPKINHEFAAQEGRIKLYNNQVFVADNVKEVIPEFLMLLKGAIDCPDLPLNVSRSFLQNDGYVKKISSHITKKVADKLGDLYKKDRENFEKYWDDINIFIKYGCMRDEKFYDKVKNYILYKDLDGKYQTIADLKGEDDNKDIYYVTDENLQSQYINMLKNQGENAVMMPSVMDTHFMSFMESKEVSVKFKRIDSAFSDALLDENNSGSDEVVELFKNTLKKDELKFEAKALKSDDLPAILLVSEESRRMKEMYRSYGQQFMGMSDMFHEEYTLIINLNNAVIKKLPELDIEKQELLIGQIYALATLCNKPLTPDELTDFVSRNNKILGMII